MSKYVLRRTARRDLAEIFDYIAKDNPKAAQKVIADIEAMVEVLVQKPDLGHARRDVDDQSVLFITVRSWVIAYKFDGKSIIVFRVIHGRRDFRAIF